MNKFNFEGYAKLLKDWVVFSQKHLYYCPEIDGLICYGTGINSNWGVQTNGKAFSAFAIAATLPQIDFSDTSVTREQVLNQALGMLRYSLRTHLVGDFICTNGEKWGHSWIYALGIERMFHAIEAIWEHLTDADKALLKKVMISEADFILNDYPIEAGLVVSNKPESNIWNGAILYRTAILYPDAQNRAGYLEKAAKFFANGISIESDEGCDEIVGGHRIGDLFVGANMFNSYACNHHHYLNIGYMNICLSNIAMLHFFMKSKDVKPDDIIYHNLQGLWRLIRSTTFDDGRLIRIGGDTRARYSYCQDYALVAWQLIEDVYGEDCSELENGWLEILKRETEANGDGSFLSGRFGHFENLSPLYYTRLESDRSNTISMVLYWHNKYNFGGNGKCEQISLWSDAYHGSAFASGERRFASFTWRAVEQPQGLIVPKNNSALAEWRCNLSARICGVGLRNYDEVESYSVNTLEGGFLTSGSTVSYSDDFLGEGQKKEATAKKYIAFAALDDDKTVLCLQYAVALNRVFIAETSGAFWNIPNDIFNGNVRHLFYENGDSKLLGGEHANKFETVSLGKYANTDNVLGIASISELTLVRRGKRQIEIVGRRDSGTLYCEEICSDYHKEYRWADRGAELLDSRFAMSLGDISDTKKLYEGLFAFDLKGLKAVGVTAGNSKKYVLLANFTDKAIDIDCDELKLGAATDAVTNKTVTSLSLDPLGSALLCF